MRRLFLALLLVLLCSASVMAASTCTVTQQSVGDGAMLQFSWTAAADGSFDGTTCAPSVNIKGWVTHVETQPGTPAPTANYSATLKNSQGYDVAGGALASRSQTATEVITIGTFPVFRSLALALTGNSVNGAQGTIRVYYVPFKGE